MKRYLLLLLLAGCASQPQSWWHEGASVDERERAEASCRMQARGIQQYPQQGLANVLGQIAEKHAQFDDCMRAGGWKRQPT